MKRFFLLAATAALAIVTMSALSFAAEAYGNDGYGASEGRYVSTFDEIDNMTPFSVTFIQAQKQEVIVEAAPEIIQKIRTDVVNSRLRIFFERGKYNNPKAHIIVCSPKVSSIRVLGSGDILCDSDIEASDLAMEILGSGNIVAHAISCEEFKASVMGSGDITAASVETEDADLSIAGSGNINVTKVKVADDLEMTVMGSGDIKVSGFAHEIDAKILGSGDIQGTLTYDNVTSKIKGSGRFIY